VTRGDEIEDPASSWDYAATGNPGNKLWEEKENQKPRNKLWGLNKDPGHPSFVNSTEGKQGPRLNKIEIAASYV